MKLLAAPDLPLELDDEPRGWFVVTTHAEDAEAFRSAGVAAAAITERTRLDAELPRGPGSEVLLVGAGAHALAGDFHGAGVADCWGAHVPIGYSCAAHYLEDRARVVAWSASPVELRELLRAAIEDRAWPIEPGSVAPTGHPDAPQAPRRRGVHLADVVDRWRSAGPLEHVPTGIAALDAATGGGLVLGSRVYIGGAPDAGKTALLVQLLDVYAARGLAVGMLAVDEEDEDVATRFLQRRGWLRRDCEERNPHDLGRMAEQVQGLPVVLYGPDWTIEAAGDDLARIAAERGTGAVLGIDSIQTARCEAEDGSASRYEDVTSRVGAVRSVATRHRMLTIATSEVSRASYRSNDGREGINDLAAAKESGAIEYSARVLLVLRSVPGEPDLVSARIAKNKLGPRTPDDDRLGIVLRLHRGTQQIEEVSDYKAPEEGRVAAAGQRVLLDAAMVAQALQRHPGLSSRQLRAKAAAAAGEMGRDRCDVAVQKLGEAVAKVPGGPCGAVAHYLDGEHLPDDVLNVVPIADRPALRASKPPAWPSVAERGGSVAATLDGAAEAVVCAPPIGARHTAGATLNADQSENQRGGATLAPRRKARRPSR